MASSTQTASGHSILRFGNYLKHMYNIESTPGAEFLPHERFLRQEEVSYIRHNIIGGIAPVWKPSLSIDVYHGVRQQLHSLVQVWDSLIDEKGRFDETPLTRDRSFMEAYHMALYIIPERVKIGLLEPAAIPPGPATSPGRLSPIMEDGVTVVSDDNNPERLALSDYETEAAETSSGEFEDSCWDGGWEEDSDSESRWPPSQADAKTEVPYRECDSLSEDSNFDLLALISAEVGASGASTREHGPNVATEVQEPPVMGPAAAAGTSGASGFGARTNSRKRSRNKTEDGPSGTGRAGKKAKRANKAAELEVASQAF